MTSYKLYWVREDGQGSLDMGEYSTRAEAESAIPAMTDLLLDQCGKDSEMDGINAGSWSVDAVDA